MKIGDILELPASAVSKVKAAEVKQDDLPVETFVEDAQVELSQSNQQMIALLVANGEALPSVANKLQLQLADVQAFLRTKEGASLVVRFQSSKGNDPRQRIKGLTNLAIDTAVELLLTGKEATRTKVAIDLMDRGMGKAVQVVETRNYDSAMQDMAAADKAIAAQKARLDTLQKLEEKLLLAQKQDAQA